MKAYSIFDDFTEEAKRILTEAGVEVTIHPMGVPRPNAAEMKRILEEYDCVIIGTSQKITEEMFDNISAPRIIATASVGLDHIHVPDAKKAFVKIINTPNANAQSVAEYTMGCALACVKRMAEGGRLYRAGKDNKALYRKPEDLAGKTIGVIGAGNISVRIMEYARFFGMKVLCWTRRPDKHRELERMDVSFTDLNTLAREADVISVNLPNNAETKDLISESLISEMKPTAVFISVSRLETVNAFALLEKAAREPTFYVCMDVDVNETLSAKTVDLPNIQITPHIAGGTVETRKRMFRELAERVAKS